MIIFKELKVASLQVSLSSPKLQSMRSAFLPGNDDDKPKRLMVLEQPECFVVLIRLFWDDVEHDEVAKSQNHAHRTWKLRINVSRHKSSHEPKS